MFSELVDWVDVHEKELFGAFIAVIGVLLGLSFLFFIVAILAALVKVVG